MCARSFQAYMTAIFQQRVDQNPIWLKMAIATAHKGTTQRVVLVMRRQRLTVNQQIERRF